MPEKAVFMVGMDACASAQLPLHAHHCRSAFLLRCLWQQTWACVALHTIQTGVLDNLPESSILVKGTDNVQCAGPLSTLARGASCRGVQGAARHGTSRISDVC